MTRTADYLACPRCGLPCVGPWRCECGWHEPTGDEWLIDTNDEAEFVTMEIRVPPPVTVATVRRIAYCRVCTKQISAETAAANAGNCHAHAHSAVGVRWQASDDYRR